MVLGALGLFDRVIPDGDRPLVARPCAPCSGPWPPTSVGIPGMTTGAHSLAALLGHPDPRDHRGRPRQPGGGPPVRRGREVPPSTPIPSRPSWTSWPRPVGRRSSSPTWPATARPATPQEENRYLYALASFTGSGTGLADVRPGPDRGADPECAVPAPVAGGQPGERAGRRGSGSPRRGTPWWPGSRPTSSPACWTASAAVQLESLPTEVSAFVVAHPLPAGGRTVEQILERLAVNVAFGEAGGRRHWPPTLDRTRCGPLTAG